MLASAALIANLVRGSLLSKEIHTPDLDAIVADVETTSSAGSVATAVDDEAIVQLQSLIKTIAASVLEGVHKNNTQLSLLTANQVVDYVTSALSDLVFVYPGAASGQLGQELLANKTSPCRNYRDKIVKVTEMETRHGALLAVQGALSAEPSATATVVTSSQALLSMVSSLYTLVLRNEPVVFHVAAQSVDQDLVSRPNYDGVLAARSTGALIISSSGVQQTHDTAIAAYILAQVTRRPVIHYFDGVSSANDTQAITVASFQQLKDTFSNISSFNKDVLFDTVKTVLAKFNQTPFQYIGAHDAETVLVTLNAPASVLRAVEQAATVSHVGLCLVRTLRPWSEAEFVAQLPASTKRVVVLEQGDGLFAFNGPLYLDIAASLRFAQWHTAARPQLTTAQSATIDHLQASHIQLLADQAHTMAFIDLSAKEYIELQDTTSTGAAMFWDIDESASNVSTTSHVLSMQQQQKNASTFIGRTIRDIYRPGGTAVYSHVSSDNFYTLAQFIGIHNVALLKDYDILKSAAQKAVVLLHGPWKHGDELEPHFSNEFKRTLTEKEIDLYTLDGARLAEELALHPSSYNIVWEAAFLLLNGYSSSATDQLTSIYDTVKHEQDDQKRDVHEVVANVVKAVGKELTRVELLPPWTILEVDTVDLPRQPRQLAIVQDNDASVSQISSDLEDGGISSESGKWHAAAWQIMFKEAHQTKPAVRPDLHETTFVVRLTENRRLTPQDYDRNVFHLEFDTSKCDLTYEIGDALGVYGHNDYEEVQTFLNWYGLNASDVVLVHNEAQGRKETRTVFQLFSQTLDIFGRPSKRFYEALASYAADDKEKEQLLYLVSPEGKEAFKNRVDDTVTYEDLLREFTSAKPPLEALVQFIAPIKPRHYSIASSQKMHPNSVHLLVVAVEWTNVANKKRFGQCTRYLSNLSVGSAVTVSIKPSVMKLPPLDTQPIIMAGLGTGMAPFRAFIQERTIAKAAGKEVGPVVLYFGSRNQRNEYLYGEELEAYHADGVLSHMGLAFSRDQPNKVYIQHKMKQDAEMLHEYLINQQGHFYLCGPTWPVPDVKDAVVYGLKEYGGIDEKTASDLIEEWKEKERYILEVY